MMELGSETKDLLSLETKNGKGMDSLQNLETNATLLTL